MLLWVFLCAFTVQMAVNLMTLHPSRWGRVWGLLCFLAVCGCQVVHSLPGLARLRGRIGGWTLGLQAVLTYLPVVFYGGLWGAAGGFLAGSATLVLPPRWNWAAYGAVAASMTVTGQLLHYDVQTVAYLTTSTLLTGAMLFGLTRLATLVVELHEARELLARLAVARERIRFSRDVHDLLGYSLSAIALKGELAIRLVAHQPERAVEELTALLEVSRRALADVRDVADGYPELSLPGELATAQPLLAAAGIELTAALDARVPAGPVDTVLATVLREAVSNMLRHAKVRRCRVELTEEGRELRLLIVNDGASGTTGAGTTGAGADGRGTGLRNLRSRLAELDGRLTAAREPDGTFRLLAVVPAAALRPASPPPAPV
ncbi:sensor histidine kinase [Kitasatospora sp. NPDC057198]|uniref:sensor histidine kinase n=1 Tax=Kitasatospora sp. NPDC057198 TaxID=3346046 RepID=UPI003629071F